LITKPILARLASAVWCNCWRWFIVFPWFVKQPKSSLAKWALLDFIVFVLGALMFCTSQRITKICCWLGVNTFGTRIVLPPRFVDTTESQGFPRLRAISNISNFVLFCKFSMNEVVFFTFVLSLGD
jgi:hypothetical protein